MEEDFDLFPMTQPNKLFVRENGDGSNTYEYYFVGPIGEPEEYIDLCNALRSCEEQDIFILRFNSGGGQVRTGNQILNSMRECEGTTVGYIEHDCGSMTTFLFLACEDHYVSPYAEWFSHTVSGGHLGKESETFEASQFLRKQTHKRIRQEYEGFFEQEEIESLLKGTDIYLDSEEILERLAKFKELRYSKLEDCCGDIEDMSLEGIVKRAVKEALAEQRTVDHLNSHKPQLRGSDWFREKSREMKALGYNVPEPLDEVSEIEAESETKSEEKLPCDGLSPETAYPYCPDSILEKGVWYKWEAGQSCEFPFDAHGTILFGDGQVFEDEAFEDYDWSRHVRADDLIKAFKLDK